MQKQSPGSLVSAQRGAEPQQVPLIQGWIQTSRVWFRSRLVQDLLTVRRVGALLRDFYAQQHQGKGQK